MTATAQPEHARRVVIVQARYGSTRLPAKVLRQLTGKTVLEHVLTRCRAIEGVDEVICATGLDPANDPIVAEGGRLGFRVFRGDENDVLARYLGAARFAEADLIMRVTSDCPLIDPMICGAVFRLQAERKADYAANNMPRLFPHGLDCEVFTRTALERAATATTEAYDREHVTPWLRRHPELKRANLVGPGWPANTHRWTLDYPEDFTFFEELFACGSAAELASLQGILSLLAAHPQLSSINAGRAAAVSQNTHGTIVFRFDANQRIGTGHAVRCASLSDRFGELGWRCLWAVTAETAAFLGSSLPPGRAIIVAGDQADTQLTAIAGKAGRATAIILDHYNLPTGFDQEARQFADRVIWIDDFADRQLDADLVINSTPGIDAASYRQLLPNDAKLLLGGTAAPLRRQFLSARAAALQHSTARSTLKRILIAFGGVDPLDGTSLAIETTCVTMPDADIAVVLGSRAPHLAEVQALVARRRQAGVKIHLLLDVADMAGVMAASDLCIGAPGTSTWERCCLGLPSLLIGIAENQRANAAVMAQSSSAITCGFLTTAPRAEVAAALATALHWLRQQPAQRQEISRIAATLCDGRGIDRAVVAAQAALRLASDAQLSLRLMEPADAEMLLAWQEAPETRRYALNPHVPSPAEHHAWFVAKLLASADLPLIAEIAGDAVGYVRLDWCGESQGAPIYLVSIATAPGHYRKGIGNGMLRLARQLAPGAILLAQILPGNTASMNMFRGLGYDLRSDGYWWSLPPS